MVGTPARVSQHASRGHGQHASRRAWQTPVSTLACGRARDESWSMRYESSVTSVSWIPSEAVTGPSRAGFRLGIRPLRRPAVRGTRGPRGTPRGRQVPVRQRAAGLDRGRRRRADQRRRLRRVRNDRLHHPPAGRPARPLPGGQAARHPAAARAGAGLGAVHPDRWRPHRGADAPDGQAPPLRAVAGPAGVDHADADPARRRHRRARDDRGERVPPALGLRRRRPA